MRHYAVVKHGDESPALHPLKQWVRQHPQLGIPEGTTHEMRRAMTKQGWRMERQTDRVLMIQPDEADSTTYASTLLDDSDETALADAVEAADIEEIEEIKFGLERDMQRALRQNIGQLEKGLTIIDGGKERVTEAGRIDILATDTQGNLVVIELKAGTAAPAVISQICAYMTAVASTDHKPVRGILVANDFHKQVVLAARSIPTMQLKSYAVQFIFKSIGAE